MNTSSPWNPPEDWQRFTIVDAHTEGEPFRVILEGFPPLQGKTQLERRRFARQHHDDLRRALLWEPRGHADMYGGLLTPPVSKDADFGILFLHNEGFSTMCGHGIIAIATVVLELGLLPRKPGENTLKIDTPAGPVTAHAEVEGDRVRRVRFHNVPSFLARRDAQVEVPGFGTVRYDLAFGGAFYAYVEARDLGLGLGPEDFRSLIEAGMAIKRAVMAQGPIEHPTEPDLGFLYGTLFTGPAHHPHSHSRNVCIFADGEVDRSPTGTGVSGRLAIHHARGELELDREIHIESILGSRFTGRIVSTTTFGPYPAIVPEVSGSAWITGRGELVLAPDDPFRHGFLLR